MAWTFGPARMRCALSESGGSRRRTKPRRTPSGSFSESQRHLQDVAFLRLERALLDHRGARAHLVGAAVQAPELGAAAVGGPQAGCGQDAVHRVGRELLVLG